MQHWFREQMAMYAAYHQDPKNCATHYFGVPLILLALLIAASLVRFNLWGPIPITLATLLLMGLLVFYFAALPIIGLLSAAIHIPLLWFADFISLSSRSDVWIVIGVCFTGGWALQFIGHVFEERRPALFDNILQVFIAPAFLVAEALFTAGWLSELNSDLKKRSVKYLP